MAPPLPLSVVSVFHAASSSALAEDAAAGNWSMVSVEMGIGCLYWLSHCVNNRPVSICHELVAGGFWVDPVRVEIRRAGVGSVGVQERQRRDVKHGHTGH